MEKHKFVGKTKEDALKQAKISLEQLDENKLLVREINNKKSLFSTKVEIEIIEKDEVITFIKEQLYKLLKDIGYNVKIEISYKNDIPTYRIYSDHDSLLIGKNGKNLKALQTIITQILNKEINQNIKFTLDVNNYQEKKEKNLIRLAKNIAREVIQSKVEVKLDSMNSYERRIIHNALSNNSKVYTESIGEEPNRCVIIKPKED